MRLFDDNRTYCRQFDWKKHAENPSGPDAFSGWIENITTLISSAVGILISSSLVSAEIHGEMACSTIADESSERSGLEFEVKIVWKYEVIS